MRERRPEPLVGRADPEEDGGGNRAVGGEVLPAHDGLHLDEGLLPQLGHDRPLHRSGRVAVVHDRVVADLEVEAVRGAVGGRDSGDHALHRRAHLVAAREREGSHRAPDPGRARDHVPRRPRLERRHRDDDGVERIALPRDDLLQVRDHLSGDGDGVDALVREGAVPAASRGCRA